MSEKRAEGTALMAPPPSRAGQQGPVPVTPEGVDGSQKCHSRLGVEVPWGLLLPEWPHPHPFGPRESQDLTLSRGLGCQMSLLILTW